MKDEERTRRIDQVRDRVRKGSTVSADMQGLAADELLASLRDGAQTLDGADEATLGDAIEAHGRDHVLEAVQAGAALRTATAPVDETTDTGRILGGAHRFGARAAGLVALAAALIVVVVLRSGGATSVEVDVDWGTVAGLEVAPGASWTDAAPLTALEATPGWGAALRGAAATDDPALRRSAAVVLVGDSYGAAAVIEPAGWLVTASDLVAGAVEEAAWRGEHATVEVELVDVDARGRATSLGDERRIARVMRHDPARGLSLLRVDGLQEPLAGALKLATTAPIGGEAIALIPAPDTTGDVTRRGTVGQDWNDGRGRSGFVHEGTAYIAGTAGAPIVRLGQDGTAELVGVALGGADAVWAADLDAIGDVMMDLPSAPELFPVDPAAFVIDGSSQIEAWDADGQLDPPAKVVHRRDASGARRTTIFASTTDLDERPIRALDDGLGEADWQVFVLLDRDGRQAIGVRGEGSTPTRIWANDGSDDGTIRLWEHDAGQRWSAREVAGDGATIRCSEEQRALLRSLLR